MAELRTGIGKASFWLVLLVLLGSLLVCAHGLHESQILGKSFWIDPEGSASNAAVILVALLLLERISHWLQLSYSLLFALVAMLVATAFAGVGATVAVLLQLAAGFCIGRRLVGDRLAADFGVLLPGVIAMACGLALLSFAVGVLSLLPVNNPATYLLLLALPIAVGWRSNYAALEQVARAWRPRATQAHQPWLIALQVVIAFSLVLRLLAVLHPEVGADALAMHLVIADELKTDGRFHYDVTQSIWAVMPMASDWQFAIANMLSGEHAARLVNYGADLLIVASIYQYGARTKNALAGAVAAALYATTPLIYLETTSLFAENFWTLWCVTALLCGLGSIRAHDMRGAALTGLLLGTALAAKVITLFMAPFFIAIAGAWWLVSRGDGVRKLAAFAGMASVAGALPYLNAWLRTGNPVFPFVNQVFKSPYFESASAFGNPFFTAGPEWRTLYDVTFQTGRFLEAQPGAMGVAFMALLPAAIVFALSSSWRLRLCALCALVFVGLEFDSMAYLRYILPVVPVLAMLVGSMVGEMAERSMAVRWLLMPVVLACSLIGLFLTPNSNFHHRQISVPVFAGSEAEERYLDVYRRERRLVRVIDALQFRKVLWLGTPFYAGTGSNVYLTNWHGGWAQAAEFDALESVDDLKRWIAKNKIDAIAVAADFERCARPFVCDFLDRMTHKSYQDERISLNVPELGLLYDRELLANPGFDRDTNGWGGSGAYEAQDGSVVVSALQSFSQSVRVAGGSKYFLEVEGRCTGDKADYRAQVNWLDAAGTFIDTHIGVIECTPGYVRNDVVVTAPANAATAAVYASGHMPDKTAQITRVSFRQ